MGANVEDFYQQEVYQPIFNAVNYVKIFFTCCSLIKKPNKIQIIDTVLPATISGTSSYSNEPVIKE